MPFTYPDEVQGERRNALTIPSAIGDVLAAQFQQSYEENPILALKRFSDLTEDQVTGPRVSAEDARLVLRESGMENDLTISDAGITRAALNTLIERKRVEKRRQEVFARSQGGFGEGAARFGVAVGATLSDPLSFGLNFVPVVGQVRYARWLNTARSLGGRLAVRGAVGAAEGVAGAAIAEIPIYAMRTQEQADYDMADSLLNVAFGGVIGAGLHTTVGTAGELISRRLPSREPVPRVEPAIGEAPPRAAEPLPADVQKAIFDLGDAQRRIENLTPEAQQAALRAAVGQAVEGRTIDVEPIMAASAPSSAITTAAGVPRVQAQGLAADQINYSRDFADRLGVTADIERLAYEGRTAAEIVSALGPRLDRVREIARINGEAPASAAGQFVREARTSMGIPSLEERPEYQAWRQQYEARRSTQGPRTSRGPVARPISRPTPQAAVSPVVDPEFRTALDNAEITLAREIESGTEANLKSAEEEADLAVSDMTETAKRLGVDVKGDPDFAAVMEGVEKAERWARVAELATVCLVRGG